MYAQQHLLIDGISAKLILFLLFCVFVLLYGITVPTIIFCNLLLSRVFLLTVTDLEWKLIYVGSAEDETYDQLLESVLVGPVNVGNYRFVFQVISSVVHNICHNMFI